MITRRRVKMTAVALVILLWLVSTSSSIVEADSAIGDDPNPKIEKAQVTVSIISPVPRLMTLGRTYTISVLLTNVRHPKSDFMLILETDGKYFLVNTYKAAIQPFYVSYYGYWISPVINVRTGESRVIMFLLLPHKAYEGHNPVTITAKVYPLLGVGLVDELDSDSVGVYSIEENSLAKEGAMTALWIIIFLSTIFGCAVLLTKSKIRAHRLKRDMLIPLGLFVASIVIRAVAIENQSIYPDEPLYLDLAELAITNNWILTKIQLINQPPIFFYLVGATVLLCGRVPSFVRLVPIVAGSLTVPVLYLLAKELFGRKAALLSALLLCLSGYHIMYSRIVMIEALSLLSIMTFLLLFWKAYFREAGWNYVVLAGIALGLACLIKLTALTLILTTGLTVLWIKRSGKALFNRKIIAILTICLLIMFPYLLYLYVNDINPAVYVFERYKLQKFRPYGKVSPAFIISGVYQYDVVLSQGHYVLPWSIVFRGAALLLAFASFIYHGFLSLKGRSNSSFLTIHLFVTALFIYVILSRHRYYLLYLLVPHYILMSSFATRCFSSLRSTLRSIKSHEIKWNQRKVLLKLFVVLLAGILVGSYFVIGPTVPFTAKGEYDGVRTCVLYIKEQMDKQKNNGQLPMPVGLIEFWAFGGYGSVAYICDSYFDLYGVEARIVSLFFYQERGGYAQYGIDIDMIKTLQPTFIIVSEYMFSVYFSPRVRLEIFKDYQVAMSSETRSLDPDAQIYYVFKRTPR